MHKDPTNYGSGAEREKMSTKTTATETIKRALPPYNPPYKTEKREVPEEVRKDVQRYLNDLEMRRRTLRH